MHRHPLSPPADRRDPVTLTERLVDIPSVSGDEQAIADAVEAALRGSTTSRCERFGNTVVARTAPRPRRAGRARRPPRHRAGQRQPAVAPRGRRPPRARQLRHEGRRRGRAAPGGDGARAHPRRDLPVLRLRGGRGRAQRPDQARRRRGPTCSTADFAVLMEPSNAVVEAGCQGTLRVDVTVTGRARPLGALLAGRQRHPRRRRRAGRGSRPTRPRRPVIDGLEYHEGLNAVFIAGGVAGNVIPDRCVVTVNHRFAPDRSEEEALAFVREFFAPYDVAVSTPRPARCPASSVPAAAALRGGRRRRRRNPKFGWTDVARFSGLGVPAVNFGPGDPLFAHKQDEHVPVEHIERVARAAADAGWRRRSVTGGRSDRRARALPAGRVRLRGSQADRAAARPTSACSTPAGPSDWVHTDPWRVLRIQSEFVDGLRRAGRAGPGRRGLRLRPHPARRPGAGPLAEESAAAWPRPGFAVITGGGPGRDGGGQQGRPRGRRASRSGSASSCPSRPG